MTEIESESADGRSHDWMLSEQPALKPASKIWRAACVGQQSLRADTDREEINVVARENSVSRTVILYNYESRMTAAVSDWILGKSGWLDEFYFI